MGCFSITWALNQADMTLLQLALTEDLGSPAIDLTSQTLFADSAAPQAQARIVSKQAESIMMCGGLVCQTLIKQLDPSYECELHIADGECAEPKATLLTLSGSLSTVLQLERTLLNFLRHLCAIATLTQQFVTRVADTQLKILDTRKTTPGWRHLEKYAVQCGGGTNHRQGLYDAVMVKDTLVDCLGGMTKVLERLPENPDFPVIIEVRDLAELDAVLTHGQNKVTRVLLDNMDCETLKQAVNLCENIFPTEASGNITLETITDIAATGVDYASIGRLTYAAGHVDLAMYTDN